MLLGAQAKAYATVKDRSPTLPGPGTDGYLGVRRHGTARGTRQDRCFRSQTPFRVLACA